jgi:hypothetical protein
MEVGGQRHALIALSLGKDPVPVVEEIWWAPGPVWAGAENCTPQPGFNPRTGPTLSESLYRLSYTGPRIKRGPQEN